MIIIADSGASKIDWRLLRDDGTIDQVQTPGFNPYYQPIEHLVTSIHSDLLVKVGREKVDEIYYYGTGVSSEKNQETIQHAFISVFSDAQVEIGWDLLAAARALCGKEAGIACILGTGSNSCFYDGKNIVANEPNLGWILADEGSGAWLGKQLLVDYFRQRIPDEITQRFHQRYPFSREEFLEKIYQQERPSSFLGGFSKFIFQNLNNAYCYELVYRGFSEFFETTVMKYQNFASFKVHFTGSIAFYFSDLLRQVANDKGIVVRNILESPIAGLSIYHKKD